VAGWENVKQEWRVGRHVRAEAESSVGRHGAGWGVGGEGASIPIGSYAIPQRQDRWKSTRSLEDFWLCDTKNVFCSFRVGLRTRAWGGRKASATITES
jgi:hypothetical protein